MVTYLFGVLRIPFHALLHNREQTLHQMLDSTTTSHHDGRYNTVVG